MDCQTVIGLEIHVELRTHTKIFCGCRNEVPQGPNENICPVCMGYPGALPRLNGSVVDYGLRAALALECQVHRDTHMDRKHYFYPDLPKGYQITQAAKPLGINGGLYLEKADKTVKIQRIHIEEDTAKMIHREDTTDIDYNRSGVPLIEIVTAPEISSENELLEFLEELKNVLAFLEISDLKMEEGSLRCDLNINVADRQGDRITPVMEVKNLNSFKGALKAAHYEQQRLLKALRKNKPLERETRGWDQKKEQTYTLRKKEDGEEYQFFVEPEILPIRFTEQKIRNAYNRLPELPYNKRMRFKKQYGLPDYDVRILTKNPYVADFFEQALLQCYAPKRISNWIMTQLLSEMPKGLEGFPQLTLKAKDFGKLIGLIDQGRVPKKIGERILKEIIKTGEDPEKILKYRSIGPITDPAAIDRIVQELLKEHPKAVQDYSRKPDKSLQYLMGKGMEKTEGRLDPKGFRKILIEGLEENTGL